MSDSFPAAIGWPAVVLALVLAISGLSTKRAYFLIASAVLTIPFALYLGASPRYQIVGFFVPALFLGAAYCMKRRVYWLAWLFLLPYVSLIGWLGKMAMSQ